MQETPVQTLGWEDPLEENMFKSSMIQINVVMLSSEGIMLAFFFPLRIRDYLFNKHVFNAYHVPDTLPST